MSTKGDKMEDWARFESKVTVPRGWKMTPDEIRAIYWAKDERLLRDTLTYLKSFLEIPARECWSFKRRCGRKFYMGEWRTK